MDEKIHQLEQQASLGDEDAIEKLEQLKSKIRPKVDPLDLLGLMQHQVEWIKRLRQMADDKYRQQQEMAARFWQWRRDREEQQSRFQQAMMEQYLNGQTLVEQYRQAAEELSRPPILEYLPPEF